MLRLLALVLTTTLAAGPSGRALADAPYTWLYGAHDIGSLPVAKALGLNTIFLQMPTEVSPALLAQARVVVTQADRLGLHVIVGLPTTMEGRFKPSLNSAPYVEALAAYVSEVVPALRDEAAVIGWATGDHLEKELSLSDAGFRAYLLAKYGTLAGLSDQWKTEVRSALSITMDDALELDDELPFGAGMPSIDLADYQAQAYRDMMVYWAELIREAVPEDDLLFTGRVSLYRSLPLIPDEYDVIVTATPPDLLEPDWETHNVQSIDIARRCGRREVIPCLRLPGPLNQIEAFAAQRLHEWMMIAAMHGAAGLCFEAPPEAMRERVVHKQLASGLSWMSEQAAFRSRPRAVAAALYEPYADGFAALDTPVYGFIKGLSAREPSDLFNSFKHGTRFGLLDYLTIDDLPTAELGGYSVIFAPMALDLPNAAQEALAEYVQGGGVLVADIGAGFVQTGSWQALPPRLEALFGVQPFHEMKSLTGNLSVHQPHQAFPSLRSGVSTTGDFEGGSHGRRTGAGAYAVSSWAGFVPLPAGTVPFARLAMSVTEDEQPTFAGVVVRDVGAGTAVFATHRLWSSWLPGHQLFNEFHADLWQRRARVELLGAPFVAPSVLIAESDDGTVFLYNPGRRVRVEVALYGAEHRLSSNAVCQFAARLVDETGLRTGGVLATVEVPGHASLEVAPTPILVRPYAGVSSAAVEHYGEDRIRLIVAGDGSAPFGKPGELQVSRGTRQNVRLTVASGEYEVTPDSKHLLRAADEFDRSTEKVLTGDEEGRLRVDLQVERARIAIEPMP